MSLGSSKNPFFDRLKKAGSRFEVWVKTKGRWIIHKSFAIKETALKLARKLLGTGFYQGVQVIQDKLAPGGASKEKIFSDEDLTAKIEAMDDDRVVNTMAVCQTVDEIYRGPSRRVINRLFRDFLVENVITPTELLYGGKHLNALESREYVLSSFVAQAAEIQARQTDQSAEDRRKVLMGFFLTIQKRAADTTAVALENKILAELDAPLSAKGNIRASVYAGVTNRLANLRSWTAKFEKLMALARPGQPPWCDQVLDMFIADIVDAKSGVSATTGLQRDLGDGVGLFADLLSGRYKPDKRDGPLAPLLAKALKHFNLVRTRARIRGYLVVELSGSTPLTRSGKDQELAKLKHVINSLSIDGLLLFDGALAAAVTTRYQRCLTDDLSLGSPVKAVKGVLALLNGAGLQLKFLLHLSTTPFGKRNASLIEGHIATIAATVGEIYDVTYFRLPMEQKLAEASALYRLAKANSSPAGAAEQLADQLDRIVLEFLKDERVIDQIDNPDLGLYERANELLNFCASGLLSDNLAIAFARARVVEHLRHPNFTELYCQGMPDAKARDARLRDLRKLVAAAGIDL